MLRLFTFAQVLAVETIDAFRKREEGQTMAEYGVVLAVITLAVIVALGALSGKIGDAFNAVASKL